MAGKIGVKKKYKIILDKGEIRERAIDILESLHYECWRQNNIAVKGRKFIGRKGVPDIIGYGKYRGKFIGCEVKAVGDKISEEQVTFLKQLQLCGGVALIATQNEDGIVMINPFKD